MGRKLTPEEAAQLGLDAPAPPPPPEAPQQPEPPSIWDRYIKAMGRGGSRTGGVIGGIAGQALSKGNPLGTAAGAFAGNLLGQGPSLTPEQQGLRPPGLAAMAKGETGRVPPPADYAPDYEAAAADAVTQGTFSGAMKLAGAGAARLGFPRVAGVLGARPPAEAVAASTPGEVSGMSTGALKNIDAGSPLGAGAVKELAKAHRLLTPLNQSIAAGGAEERIPAIGARMGARDTSELLPATQNFSKALDAADIPAGERAAAFANAPSVEKAAIDPGVREARQKLVTAAVPQGTDAQALGTAQGRLANAESLGVKASDAPQLAADRAGYTKFSGPYVNRSGSPISQTVPQRVSQALAPEYLEGDRALQVLGSELGKRGEQTLNPEVAKWLAGGATFRASPVAQAEAEILRRFLSKNR